MLDIQKAIKKIIERYIVCMVTLDDAVSAGDTMIPVTSTRRINIGDNIVVYNKPSATIQAEGEVHIVTDIPDKGIVEIDSPLVSSYSIPNSYIEKLIGFESGNETFLEAVYIGDPAVIPRYPAITVDAKSRNSEWLTLESTSEKYDIDITIYVTAADYESQYELMHSYVQAIECSLFRSFYPLVDPYQITTLSEDVIASDTLIRTPDDDLLQCGLGWIWLESYDYLRTNRVSSYLGNGAYELMFPVGREFSAGDSVIRPRRHIYNTLPHTTRYGTVSRETMLKAAVISYYAQEEVRRYVPYLDPLTF